MQFFQMRYAGRRFFRVMVLIILSLIGAGLIVMTTLGEPAITAQAEEGSRQGWTNIFTETFEGGFVHPWAITNTTLVTGYMWGTSTFTASEGTYSAWMIGAPAGLDPLTDTYTNSVSSWMVYGPLTLTGYVDAELVFDVWLDMQAGDSLHAFGTSDFTDVHTRTPQLSGVILTGTQRAWHTITIPFKSLVGSPQVWLCFGFVSDDDDQVATGVFVDNIVVRTLDRYRLYLPYVAKRWPPVPDAPSLFEINIPTWANSYTVTWQSAYLAEWYTLEEANNSDFISATTYTAGAMLSQAFFSQSDGTYYYRVRGHNSYGYGDWSNTVFVTVKPNYFEHFGDPTSGWLITDTITYTVGYAGSDYRMYVPLDFRGGGEVDSWFVNPVALAPISPPSGRPYCVSVDTYFVESGWWSIHGLVFGATADAHRLYSLQTNANGDWAVLKHTSYEFPYGRDSDWIIDWHNGHTWPVRPDNKLNHLKVSVDGTKAIFYINGHRLATEYLNDLPLMKYVGVIGGSYEVTPIDARFDNFMWSVDLGECPQ